MAPFLSNSLNCFNNHVGGGGFRDDVIHKIKLNSGSATKCVKVEKENMTMVTISDVETTFKLKLTLDSEKIVRKAVELIIREARGVAVAVSVDRDKNELTIKGAVSSSILAAKLERALNLPVEVVQVESAAALEGNSDGSEVAFEACGSNRTLIRFHSPFSEDNASWCTIM